MKIRQIEDLKQEFSSNKNFNDLLAQVSLEAEIGGNIEVCELSDLSIPESTFLAIPHDKSDSRRSIKKPLVVNISRVKELTIWNTSAVIICKKQNIDDKAFVLYRDWENGQLRLYIG